MSASFERGYNAFKEQIDAPTAAFFQSCVHCGLCAEACLFFTETQEPKYTPIHKLEPMRKVWEQEYTLLGRLKALIGLAQKVTDSELAQWQELIYGSCTLCGRCSMVCPVGNDIAYMLRKAREGMVAAGHAPAGLIAASKRAVTIGSPMGIKLPALQAQIKHVERDTGLEIPLDQSDVDYMVLLSSMEIINFPEYLEAIAKIMKQAGKTWTISTEAFEATNSGIQIGASDIAKELVSRVINAAEKLNVKTVISPECGHAFMAIRWEGPNLIGRAYKFKVQHILEVLDEFRAQGKLKVSGQLTGRVTYHDPCQIARRGGVIEQPRNLLKMIATDFVEMEDSGKMNWCCGGGGGHSAIEEAADLRTQAFNRKKSQLDALKVDTLITACANCRIIIEEGFEHNEMSLPLLGLTETLAEHLVENH
ncbi:MAG: (Fe-S)-binding protein [Pseudomonadota bacterium]|nr:(Fe-S)-binding protein [Pseudomonadota bacterium]